jgi:hypothetical protein
MNETDVITAARVEQTELWAGQPGQSEVHVSVAPGGIDWHQLFAFYADEYTFTAVEFVGLTVAQARQLHFDRDVAYLRSP